MSCHHTTGADSKAGQSGDLEYTTVLQSSEIASTAVPPTTRMQLSVLNHLPPCALDNEIHPLFTRDRWPDLEKEDYMLLLPALRIATKFMTEPSLLGWWKHTFFDLQIYKGGNECYLECTDLEASTQASQVLQEFFEKILPRDLQFQFHNLDKKASRVDGCTFGTDALYQRFRCRHDPKYLFLIYEAPHIVLHVQYLFSLQYFAIHGSQDELKNLHLRIAITICHELAHVVWKFRVGSDATFWASSIECKEPLHKKSDQTPELGRSWELHVFGGSICTIDRPRAFTTVYKYQGCLENSASWQKAIVVPTWWINIWSSKHMWDNFGKLFALGELRLPSEEESGYALHNRGLCRVPVWTLYHNGKPKVYHCRSPKSSTMFLWSVMRPQMQKTLVRFQANMLSQSSQSNKDNKKAPDKSASKMDDVARLLDLLISPELIDQSSPEVLRRLVDNLVECSDKCLQKILEGMMLKQSFAHMALQQP